MTVPWERSRAVNATREFLQNLVNDTTVDVQLRTHAGYLLRHYPTEYQILRVGQVEHALYGLRVGAQLPPEATVISPVFGTRDDPA